MQAQGLVVKILLILQLLNWQSVNLPASILKEILSNLNISSMSVKKVLVPVDFSDVTKVVVETAALIAHEGKMDMTLLHIENNKTSQEIKDIAENLIEETRLKWPVHIDFLLKKGNIFDDISNVASDDQYKIMVIGSHGFKGLREKVFGVDILKLLKNVPIPVVSVQKDFKLPEDAFKTILVPVGSHKTFINQIKSTMNFASIFNSKVHLYSVEKPGVQWSDELKLNIKSAEEQFQKNNIHFEKVKEIQNSFSVGFSKQIMDYAQRQQISLISIMANATKELYYIADSDKVTMLTNKAFIPILSSNEKTLN